MFSLWRNRSRCFFCCEKKKQNEITPCTSCFQHAFSLSEMRIQREITINFNKFRHILKNIPDEKLQPFCLFPVITVTRSASRFHLSHNFPKGSARCFLMALKGSFMLVFWYSAESEKKRHSCEGEALLFRTKIPYVSLSKIVLTTVRQNPWRLCQPQKKDIITQQEDAFPEFSSPIRTHGWRMTALHFLGSVLRCSAIFVEFRFWSVASRAFQ